MRKHPVLLAAALALVACSGQADRVATGESAAAARQPSPSKTGGPADGAAPADATASSPFSPACLALATAKPGAVTPADWVVLDPRAANAPGTLDVEENYTELTSNGRYAAVKTTGDAKVHAFDLTTGTALPWSGKYERVQKLEIGGERALFSIGEDKVDVYLVDLPTGRVLAKKRADLYDNLTVSPDGSVFSITTTAANGTELAIFKGADGRPVKTLRLRGLPYFSSDGRAIVEAVEKEGRGGATECSLEVHSLDGSVASRRVRLPSSCPRSIAVGRRAERIAWTATARPSETYVYVSDKGAAPRQGPRIQTSWTASVELDESEERVAVAGGSGFEVGRITDAKLEPRAGYDPRRVVFGPEGTFAEAWKYGIVRYTPSGATEIVGPPLAKSARGAASDNTSLVQLLGSSARWYQKDGALIGGVLTLGGFEGAAVGGDELTLLSSRGELSIKRAQAGVALESFLPMKSSCHSYSSRDCVRLAPGLIANLDIANAHIGHHATVRFAGPFPTDDAPEGIESPIVRGHHSVASDGTFLSVGDEVMAMRNVCAPEAWRTLRVPGLKARDVSACPRFAIVTAAGYTASSRSWEAVSTVDGARLGTLTTDDGLSPSCEEMRAVFARDKR